MERGGLRGTDERVFLLSTTHGAETHSLAAAIAVMGVYREEGIADRLHALGARLGAGVREAAASMGVERHVVVRGRSCNLVFETLDEDFAPSQPYRTLFLRQLISRGVLAPSLVVSSELTDDDIDRTVDAVGQACAVYRKALDVQDPIAWMGGRSIQRVFRPYAR
jgi:glutamate-1-semialdehyde 2,1-aminomutase